MRISLLLQILFCGKKSIRMLLHLICGLAPLLLVCVLQTFQRKDWKLLATQYKWEREVLIRYCSLSLCSQISTAVVLSSFIVDKQGPSINNIFLSTRLCGKNISIEFVYRLLSCLVVFLYPQFKKLDVNEKAEYILAQIQFCHL